jgi:peptidoglycan hydrolase-like protein with peptidoglycan-binding domain
MKQASKERSLLIVFLCIFLCSCSLAKMGGTGIRKIGTTIEDAAGGGDEPKDLKEATNEHIDDTTTSRIDETTIIIRVQKRLKELGYNPGPADGIIGNKTRMAIGKYQQSNGLRVTNSIDEETLSSLEGRATATIEDEAGGDEPANLQETKTEQSKKEDIDGVTKIGKNRYEIRVDSMTDPDGEFTKKGRQVCPGGYRVIERTKRGDSMVTIVGTIECE